MRQSAEADPYFEKAAGLFEQVGLSGELGRTLVAQMDNLMYLSRYTEALNLAGRAHTALTKAKDAQYLSTLEIALGNIYYRLGRYNEALSHYDYAQSLLEKVDTSLAHASLASIGLNRAYVLTEMNRFDEAAHKTQHLVAVAGIIQRRCESWNKSGEDTKNWAMHGELDSATWTARRSIWN